MRSSLCLEAEIHASPASSRHRSATQVCHPPTHTSISTHGTHRHTSVGAYTDRPAEKAEARARGRPLLVVTVSLSSFPPLTNLSSREHRRQPLTACRPPSTWAPVPLPSAHCHPQDPKGPFPGLWPRPWVCFSDLTSTSTHNAPTVSRDRHGTAHNDHPHSLPPAHNLPDCPLSRPPCLACSHRPRCRSHTRTHYLEPKFPSTDIPYSLAVQALR